MAVVPVKAASAGARGPASRDEDVKVAVLIVIHPGDVRTIARCDDRRVRYRHQMAFAVVMPENVLCEVANKQIDEAGQDTHHYLDVLENVSAAGVDAHISIKPTQLGLDLDKELCFRNLQRLVDRAAEHGNFVWIDMESSRYVDPTLELFRRTRARSSHIGIALQAYLYRTSHDVESLLPLGAAIRLVKGAYLEPPDVAYPKKSDVDENYYKLACRLLDENARQMGTLVHLATHDVRLAARLNAFIDDHGVPNTAYEYAMLYGIQRPLQQRLVASGRRVRVLISYGEDWFAWYMRRLAERPANVGFVLKNLVSR